jgi:hypothetical protein
MSMPKLMMAAAAAFLTSAGAAHALTTTPTPVPIEGYYTITYGSVNGNGPTSFTKPSSSLGTPNSSTGHWNFDLPNGGLTSGSATSEMNLFIANPNNCYSGSGRTCVNTGGNTATGTITVTFTFTNSAGSAIGSLMETGEYEAKYGGSELGCAAGDGVSPTSGNTDCIVWNGLSTNGSVLRTTTLTGFPNDIIDLTFYNASDWSMVPEMTLGVNDPAPTPLPAALPLFAGGLGGLGLLTWRRKRKAH